MTKSIGMVYLLSLRDYLKTDFGIDFSAKNRNSLHEFLGFEIVTKRLSQN